VSAWRKVTNFVDGTVLRIAALLHLGSAEKAVLDPGGSARHHATSALTVSIMNGLLTAWTASSSTAIRKIYMPAH
jgi:hypothetical protein